MNDWIEIRIISEGLSDELIGQPLRDIGAEGLIPEKNMLKVFFRKQTWGKKNEQATKKILEPFIDQGLINNARIEIYAAENEDWIGRWRRSLGAVRAGKNFVIVPPGIDYNKKPGDVVLSIEPRMAFGTGEHSTTTMALELLETVVNSGSKVIDIGCGNGVLSLASLLLGAESVVALDNETEAVTETSENLGKYGFSDKSEIILCDAIDFQVDRKFNVVLANILFRPIMAGLKNWKELAVPQSHIILTGIQFGAECEEVNRYASELGLRLDLSIHDDNWYAARYILK